MKIKHLQATTTMKGGKLLAIASTQNEDRVGDALDMKDWDLSKFKANPVLQAGHDYRPEFTIGIAKNMRVEGKQLVFEPEFHDLTQLARDIKAMYTSDPAILKAWSVGFIPKELKEGDNAKHELLEVSAVAVPANAECLTIAKGYGNEEASKVKEWIGNEVEEKEEEEVEEKEEKEEEKVEEKSIEKKENEEVTETVNDELDEAQARKQKWDNFDQVDSIMYAFYKVYMQKEIPVEDFDNLLKEAIGLLGNLTGATEKKFESELLKDFDGKLSEVTKEVEDGKMDTVVEAVEELKKSVSQNNDTIIALGETIKETQAKKAKGDDGVKSREPKEVKGQKSISGDTVVLRALQKIAKEANKGLHKIKK